jgi:alkanesulfonate monooxygenase SsuD/methylene tetrahydromethanopterin reductase-like flavin-dependent oxidoreductase (luciferase family)
VTHLGLLLPTRERVLEGRSDPQAILRLAEAAEAAGLDSVWVGESPLVRPRHDMFAMLAAVAARTSEVTIGSAVALAPIRHPMLLLHQAATVDQLSRGRLILGLGAGYPMAQTQQQFEALGADYVRRGSRLEDTFRLARHLWHSGRSDRFDGRTVTVEAPVIEPGPWCAGGPPIWLAGSGATALRRVGRSADGWLPYPPSPEHYADDWAQVCRHAAEVGRRPPVAGLYATVTVHQDPQEARRLADEYLERYYGIPAELVRLVQASCAGSPDQVLTWLRSYRDAGATHLVIRFAGEVDRQAIEWLAQVRQDLRSRRSGDKVTRRRSAV